MLLQWCLRGIPERRKTLNRTGFGDAEAQNTLIFLGLRSNWVLNTAVKSSTEVTFASANASLSLKALDDHVNAFATVKSQTPYLSLTAGAVVPVGASGQQVFPAWATAIAFATRGGRQRTAGYVFECWVPVGPKPVAEIPGFGEEVRDLNASRQFCIWHREGEIAAKLVVPPRQILRVVKFHSNGNKDQNFGAQGEIRNKNFVKPERLSNLRGLVF
jgi:hypothetical protein